MYGAFFTSEIQPTGWSWNIGRNLQFAALQGFFGVQLFFVISGFILGLPFAEQHLIGQRKVSLKKYFLRRVTRLEPPYLINLLVWYGIIVFIRHNSAAEYFDNLAASWFYVHNLVYGDASAINPVAWSLEVEVQFYIIAPLLGFAIRDVLQRRGTLIAGIVAASLLMGVMPMNCVLGQLRYFLMGFFLADIYILNWQYKPTKHWSWDIIGLLCWLAIPVLISNYTLRFLFIPPVMILAYIGAFRGPILNRFFSFGWVTVIGGMCYTIYLYHFMLMDAFRDIWPVQKDAFGWLEAVQAGGMLLFVLAVSAVLFLLLEKPFMQRDWPARFTAWVRQWFTRPVVSPVTEDEPTKPWTK